MRGSMSTHADVYLRGRVIFVGSSSMLVRCEVGHTGPPLEDASDTAPTAAAAAAVAGGSEAGGKAVGTVDEAPLLVADFLYVARDRATGRASQVNRLDMAGASEADQQLYQEKLDEVGPWSCMRSWVGPCMRSWVGPWS